MFMHISKILGAVFVAVARRKMIMHNYGMAAKIKIPVKVAAIGLGALVTIAILIIVVNEFFLVCLADIKSGDGMILPALIVFFVLEPITNIVGVIMGPKVAEKYANKRGVKDDSIYTYTRIIGIVAVLIRLVILYGQKIWEVFFH